jgi:hypothetical protein
VQHITYLPSPQWLQREALSSGLEIYLFQAPQKKRRESLVFFLPAGGKFRRKGMGGFLRRKNCLSLG